MAVFTLVRRARQRLLYNELLSQGANASSAALIAVILLLLAGTQVLNWRWALAIPVIAACAGLYVACRRRPSPYTAAQMVDHRMALADTLSTALVFSQAGSPSHVSREMRRSQFEQAERLSQSVDVRKAIPYSMPRTAYPLAALLVAASSLFALRYGLSLRLDLKPPLARILLQRFGGNGPTEHGRRVRPKAQETPDLDDGTVSLSDSDQQPEVSSESIQDDGSGQPGGQSGLDQNRPSVARQGSNGSDENSGLMSKVEDAIENMLSSLNPPRSLPGAPPQTGKDESGQQGKVRQSGGKPGDSQDGQAGEEGRNSQDSQGKGTSQSDTEQASKQTGGGIGSQDGDKRIKQAEQLAAMGKITEIIGKRSANVTGEATVEVQSTSQQLRTPYARRGGQHSQSGAEIGRDEIPVALQTYVERYFEQVR
jgi:hypothetical protein